MAIAEIRDVPASPHSASRTNESATASHSEVRQTLLRRFSVETPPFAPSILANPSHTPSTVSQHCTIYIKTIPFARAKRALDVIFALIGLIAGGPFILFLALMVRLTSRGPAIFKQKRVGIGGRAFNCYKLRSMCVDAECHKDQLCHLNEVSGPVFKIKNDPRITPIGRWLRKFSLDELPQLYNVLRGEMSIVGPRPPVPSEVEEYTDRQLGRLAVKPGLTCLWQVGGRSGIAFERWVELDLMYIDTMSFWGDVRIIARTIPAVILARGAH